jgi:hypothetical protein
MGACPKCNTPINSVRIQRVEGREGILEQGWKCFAYLCPSCGCVLSVSVDPEGLKNEIVDAVLSAIRLGR